jgi:hypothetical protein
MKKNIYLKVANFTFMILLLLGAVSQKVVAQTVSNVTVNGIGLSPTLSWEYTISGSIDRFLIQVSENGATPVDYVPSHPYDNAVTSDTIAITPALTLGSSYEFFVHAINACDDTLSTGSVTYTPTGGMITVGEVSKTPNEIKITVEDGTHGATHYDIYYQIKGAQGPANELPNKNPHFGSEKFYDLTGLLADMPYEIWVQPMKGSEPFSRSNLIEVRTARNKPENFVYYFETVSVCPRSITLKWQLKDPVGQIQGYKVSEQKQGLGTIFEVLGPQPGEIILPLSDLLPDHPYEFIIEAYNESGIGYSQPLPVKTGKELAPEAPQIIAYNVTDKSFEIGWQNLPTNNDACWNKVVDEYEIELQITHLDGTTDFKRTWAYPTDVFKVLTEEHGLKPGDKVSVKLVAVWKHLQQLNGNGRGYSEPIEVQLKTAPYKPENLAVSSYKNALNQEQVNVTWDSNPNNDVASKVTGGVVEILNEDGSLRERITTVTTNKLTIKPVEEGETFRVRVADSNAYGTSDFTESMPITIEYSAAPEAPAGLTARRVNGSAVLNWRDASNRENETIIERSTDNGTNWSEIGRVARNVTTYTDGAASAGALQYRAKASNPKGASVASNVANLAASGAAVAEVTVFPNPTSDFLNLKVASVNGKGQVTVIDQSNRAVLKRGIEFREGESSVNISDLKPGSYQVVIEAGDVQTSKKVFKF